LTQQISLLESENATLKQNKYAIEENNSVLAECDHLRELNMELQDQIKLLESELSKLKSNVEM
jgi:regulator of replication initiation timing